MVANGPFYHGDLDKDTAAGLLLENDGSNVDGKFLFRNRISTEDFVLSVIYKGKPTHHMIQTTSGGELKLNNQETGCRDFVELTKYLEKSQKKWPVPLVEGVQATSSTYQSAQGHERTDDQSDSADIVSSENDRHGEYFHEAISKKQAEELLSADDGLSTSGKFLFRALPDGNFVISVVYKSAVTHHKVTPSGPGGNFVVNGVEVPCSTLVELHSHYSTKQKKWPVPLTQGVVRARREIDEEGETPPPPPPRPSKKSNKESTGGGGSSSGTTVSEVVAGRGDTEVGPYYHGTLSKDAANHLLLADNGKSEDGKFLFRASKENDLEYILSVVYKGKPTHHQVVRRAVGDSFTVNKTMTTSSTSLVQLHEYLTQERPKWPVALATGVQNSQNNCDTGEVIAQARTIVDANTKPPKDGVEDTGPFFHGEMSKDVSEKLLLANGGAGQSGKFLFRCKGKMLILSVVYKKVATHHAIDREKIGAELILSKSPTGCVSIPELTEFLNQKRKTPKWPVPLTEGVPGPQAQTQLSAPAQVGGQEYQEFSGGITSDPGTTQVSEIDGGDDGTAESPYLHGPISKSQAEKLLYEDNGKHSSGKFLVRKHAKKDQHYVMSVIYKTEATHHLITPDATGSSKLAINKQSTGTTTVAELIDYLREKRPKWPVPLTEGVRNGSSTPVAQGNPPTVVASSLEPMSTIQSNSELPQATARAAPVSGIVQKNNVTNTWRRKKLEEIAPKPTVIGRWGPPESSSMPNVLQTKYDQEESERRHRRSLENIFKQPAVALENGLMLTASSQRRMVSPTGSVAASPQGFELLPPTSVPDAEECTFLGNCTCQNCRDTSI